jgi:DNA-directed RNA polymerase subunit RPC12/RpoP
MELISLSCNNCGAPLEAPESAKYLTCAFCGSRLSVQRTGSAYYTNVMEQIAENTAQTAKAVEALDQSQWETAEIVWYHNYVGFMKTENRWIAAAIGVNGKYNAAQSSLFKGKLMRIESTGEYVMDKGTESLAAHKELQERLVQEGWEPVVHANKYWYSRHYRRRVKHT